MGADVDLYLGKRLRRRRRLLGLTQQQVAEGVGIRFQQIQKYECGANRISAARLWQLAQALDVPVSYFYDGLDEYQPRNFEQPEARLIDPTVRKDAQDLISAYNRLGERPRRRVLDLAKSLDTDSSV